MALCGACTVHLADEATRSCVLPISEVGERGVATIDAIGSDRVGRVVQQAWLEMTSRSADTVRTAKSWPAEALLKVTPRPSDVDIEGAMTNLCRCATYVRIRAAIKNGSRLLI